MEQKTFDSTLYDKINLIIQQNPKNTSFQWFIVGFLYAHPNNTDSIENIFSSVNSVVELPKNGRYLTPDNANQILIMMVNNLLNSQVNICTLLSL